jgi:putative membrane protein
VNKYVIALTVERFTDSVDSPKHHTSTARFNRNVANTPVPQGGKVMTKQQLLKTAHIWSVIIFIASVLALVSAVPRESSSFAQNSNSNTSARNQNSKSDRAANKNSDKNNAQGERAGAPAHSQDTSFMTDAAAAGLMEVELGRMATTQGGSDAVKQFGQRMVDDHSSANTALMQLASTKGVTLPTAIDDKQKNDMAKFSKLTGADFDKAYAKQMVSDHNKAVSLFEKESTKGTDPDLKAFATKTLPTLQEHLQMAKSLAGTSSGPKNSNSNRP